jgi:curli biogenesis system outer membrane secretion channel CsgG
MAYHRRTQMNAKTAAAHRRYLGRATRALAALSMVLIGILPASARSGGPAKANIDTSAPSTTSGSRLRYRVAVDQFKVDETRRARLDLPIHVAEGLQAMLVDRLQQSGWFLVMEREITAQSQAKEEDAIAAAKQEQVRQDGGPVIADRQRRTPAAYIITPTVVGFDVTSGGGRAVDLGPFKVGQRRQDATVTLNIRISDAQSSEVLFTATAEGKHSCKDTSVGVDLGGIKIGDSRYNESAPGRAIDQAVSAAVDKVVERMRQEKWSALVAAQDEQTGRVIINAGSASGVAVGQEFDVYRTGKMVRDPDTGAIISRGDEVRIGTIRIARVDNGVAYADPVEGKQFEARNVVRCSR